MKKLLFSIIIFNLIVFSNCSNIYAKDTSIQSSERSNHSYTIEYLEDGSFIETIIEAEPTIIKSSIRKGSKTKNYKDTNGKILWSLKVQGTFTYNGKTATCTDSKVYTNNYASNWRLSNPSSSKSKNIAKATVTAKEYTILNNLKKTVNLSASLTCSPSGTLS